MTPSTEGKADEGQAKERFWAIVAKLIRDADVLTIARQLKVSPSAIRTWRLRQHVPRLAHRQALYRALGVPGEVEEYDAAQWADYQTSLTGSHIHGDELAGKPSWLFYPDDILRAETGLSASASVIVMTADAKDDAQVGEVRSVVRSNVLRGVNYLYVIPRDCPQRDDLVRLAKSHRNAAGHGRIHIMVTPAESGGSEWSLIDYAWLSTKPGFALDKEAIANIEAENVDLVFEQLYKSGDLLPPDYQPATTERHIWICSPHRRLARFLKLLRDWSDGEAWL